MMNVYPALNIGLALRLITVPNWKLHIAAFQKLFHLVPNFLVPPSWEFQLSLPSFCNPILNPEKAVTVLQLVRKSPMTPCSLDLLYYTWVEMVATNEAIAAVMPVFVAKITDIENKNL